MDQSGADMVINDEAENEWKSNSTKDECNLLRTCLVCKSEFTNREPRLLPCLHTFCKGCVPTGIRSPSPITADCQERSNEEGIICCPACRQTCFTSDVVENVFIRDYPQVIQKMEKHCSDCEEKKPALHFCLDCNKWLCTTCSEEHVHGKDTKHHKLSTPERNGGDESEVSELPLFCPLHSKEPLKLFCETCDVLACWNCQLTQHKGHSFKYLEDALQNQKMILEELTLKMEEKKVSIQSSAKQVQDRLNEVKQMRMKIENQIKMAKMIMMNELNKRVNVLMEQLERITNERKRKLEHQLQAVMDLCKHLEHVLNFINWAVAKKNNIPFLFSKELILFQMRRLLETQCNVDLGSSKIQFRWDSTTWSKQLSNLGYLSFDCENATRQECQPSFHQQASPVPCDIATHGPSLQPSLLCQNPGQQYSVCNSHCPDLHPLHKEQKALNCLQHHQSLGQIPGHLQHQLQMQYSSMHQSQSQQKYFPHPLPVQPIPTLQQWHVAQTGLEQSPVLMGHLQAQHLQQSLHPTYTMQQQRSIKPMHMVALQQSKQLVHQPQPQRQRCQIQHLKQSTSQPYPIKQQLQLQQIQQQPSLEEAQGKSHPQKTGQQSTVRKQTCQSDQMPTGFKDLVEKPHQFTRNTQHVQDTNLKQNSIMRQPDPKKQELPVELQQLGLQRVAINDQDQQTGLGQHNDDSQLHNHLDATEQQFINCHRKSTIPLQPLDLLGIRNTIGKLSTATKKKSSTALKKRNKRSASGHIKSILPVDEGSSQLAPCLIELQSPSTMRRSNGSNQDLPTENIMVNGEQKSTEPEDNNTLPNESMQIKPVPIEDNGFKEPMNLSVNVGDPAVNGSHDLTMDSSNGVPPGKANTRTPIDGVKVPYVRLERLPICAPSTGQLPVFKLQTDVDENESKLLCNNSETKHTATRNITLDSTLTPPNSNPPPPQELDDTTVTSDLHSDVAASPSPSDNKPSEKSVGGTSAQTSPIAAVATDDNEDYCAVCLNGGELLCCDRCPKVFHLGCHVPSLLSFPMGEWLCTLCRDVVMPEVEYDCENTRHINENRGIRTLQGLSISDQRKCEKLALHLHCHPLSLPFHEPVSPLARHYYQIIKRPMDLSTVRAKLQKKSPLHYYTPEEFISDIHLMLMNCAKFNYPDSEVAQAGRSLEACFDENLKEIYPDKSLAGTAQEDSDYEEIDNESGTVTINGFTWPTKEKEHVKPKRRRRNGGSHNQKDNRP